MYIWKTKALAEELKKNTLPDKDRFLHLLFFVAIQAFLIELSVYNGQIVTPYNLAVSAALVGITIIGTWFCYRANKSGDGKDFTGRYVCMWLPLAATDSFQTVEVKSIKAPGKQSTLQDREHGNKILFLELGPEDSGKSLEIRYRVKRLEKATYAAPAPYKPLVRSPFSPPP